MLRKTLPLALVLPVLALLLLAVGGSASHRAGQGGSPPATPASSLPGVTAEVLVRATPDAAPSEELALGRVTVEPGASIPPHEHPGTQIATILSGELTYTVLTGTVGVTRFQMGSPAPSAAEGAIRAGETTLLRPGDSVVERPGALHTARNDGDEPVVILLATLFRAGEPRTLFATPVP